MESRLAPRQGRSGGIDSKEPVKRETKEVLLHC